MTRLIILALAAMAVLAPAAASAQPKNARVQLVGLNDFHGHLEPTTPGMISRTGGTADRVPAGGAEYLATHVRRIETFVRRTVVVSAGDLIGGSPLLSALFHDEPTVEAMNRIGLDVNAVGNHEFDEGRQELRRMKRGGCHPVDGCQDGTPFGGADFRFLAANVVREETGRPLFKPYKIKRLDGVKVAFIGMTLEGTPDIVSPSGVAGLRFLDEAETANRYARRIVDRKGVQAIVVLLHEGGVQTQPGGINDCNGISGAIVDIVERTTPEVDLFVTGHTHSAYNCVIDDRPVTSASSFGRLLTRVVLKLRRGSGEVVSVKARNRIVEQDVMRAPDLTTLIERYTELAAPLRDRVIGRLATDASREPDDSGESPLGNLIADGQLAATDDAGTGQAVASFMNAGGVRSDLAGGEVTYGEAFSVQPFGNSLVTMTLTGAQLYDMLEQQWCGQPFARVLQPSEGVTYTYDLSVAEGNLGNPCPPAQPAVTALAIGGTPVDRNPSYRVTVNSFLAEGGDAFTTLRSGTDRLGGPVDLDALAAYLAPSVSGTPVAPPATDRITVVP